ncbi:Type 1 glutamine amidotransferase-like domain-containing protein [Pontibacillus sp. HMF3514]|uniref:Type 1 glutamine amidotransferase-like domain-containing protein n=1 Tax=Pontibacillus sp. HMF3514 TaxID=2692425 RepID=UPI00131FAF7C|nr:Type 1 glutamine amidotransferase-like domain-containing protein [Pontibacillus sp. HMF3514]QHE51488.1 type 1 glutamine amidotransferase-like domain-containing protein [Pontibacillus sp. HMF3514]
MTNLFLSGGGDEIQTKDIDQAFVQSINKHKPMLYIPIAMDEKHIPYESCYEWITNAFKSIGVNHITMWTDLCGKSLEDLQGVSSVYIGGGNTFSLLHELTQTGFIDVLSLYIAKGGIVYGGSAGAIVLGKDIRTCAHMDTNKIGLKMTEGLNLVDEYAIWCHYHPEQDELIHTYQKDYQQNVIALTEETGLKITEQGIKVIGSKKAYCFSREGKSVLEVSHYINI